MSKEMNHRVFFKDVMYFNMTLSIDDDVFKKYTENVLERCNFKYKLDLAKEALLCITANLIIGFYEDKPVMIRGGRDYWCKCAELHKWATLDRVNTIVNTLVDMGYVNKVAGLYTEKVKYIAKYWLKDESELMGIICSHKGNYIHRVETGKFIKARDESGHAMPLAKVKGNKRFITKINEGMRKINKCVGKYKIDFTVSIEELITKGKNVIEMLTLIGHYINTSTITTTIYGNQITKVIYRKDTVILCSSNCSYIVTRGNIGREVDIYYSTQCIVTTLSHPIVLGGFEEVFKGIASNDACFERISICTFFIENVVENKAQIRIFNRGNLKFGGRLYEAPWSNLPKVIRLKFKINDEPIVRLDYVSIHFSLLYNLIGLEAPAECYIYDSGNERKIIKIIALIILNAKDSKVGTYAINKKLKDSGLYVSNKHTKNMIKEFMEHHAAIEKYMFSGIGVELQRKDSDIIYNVLSRMTRQGICAISVHDELITGKSNYLVAKEAMLEEYRKEMGFEATVN